MVSSALVGYYTPAQCQNPSIVDGGTYSYVAESDDLTQHEEGVAPYNVATATLRRTLGVIHNSSNAGSSVAFSSAPKVMLTALQQDISASAGVAGDDKNVQFNDGGMFGGVGACTFDKITNTLALGVEVDTQTGAIIGTPDATTTDFRAPSLTIIVGNSKGSALGQNLILHAGDGGDGDGDGGLLDLQGGDAPGANGNGGTCALQGGTASGAGNGGLVEATAGSAGTDGTGGNVIYSAGDGGTNSGSGGYVQISAGDARGGDSDAGNITLIPGVASGAGIPGLIIFMNVPVSAPATSGAVYVDGSGFLKLAP